ncbi:MAG: hypothetical protein ETSY1_30055 [Candidatus Entotheonella factor]|uniref:Uncharacterized protein n=1 Tax=Entotheonella factor TaxID=1429438 RepID=W4LCX8_ENTF1|nr:MAG: hypothetical protein ETSY1_30055 [Candidatus Entotheonella factor]
MLLKQELMDYCLKSGCAENGNVQVYHFVWQMKLVVFVMWQHENILIKVIYGIFLRQTCSKNSRCMPISMVALKVSLILQ